MIECKQAFSPPRNEQSDLLDESVKLYETAEIGNQKLKKVIQFKDNKLEQAETELFRLRKVSQIIYVSIISLYTVYTYYYACTLLDTPAEAEISSIARNCRNLIL